MLLERLANSYVCAQLTLHTERARARTRTARIHMHHAARTSAATTSGTRHAANTSPRGWGLWVTIFSHGYRPDVVDAAVCHTHSASARWDRAEPHRADGGGTRPTFLQRHSAAACTSCAYAVALVAKGGFQPDSAEGGA